MNADVQRIQRHEPVERVEHVDNFHRTTARRDIREPNDVAEEDRHEVVLLGLDLAVHLELLRDLLRQHLAEQGVGSSFLVAQFRRLDLQFPGVFRHLAEPTSTRAAILVSVRAPPSC